MPFSISKTDSFYEKLNEWIGDVFYDILPEAGLELRDEQIFMAFQLLNAYKDKEIMFAEAGVGTGKTIVYLLYAICYARYTNKPAIIACADETLIEQLVKKEGDIAKLEKILQLDIDVRLAKSREQYICIKKLDEGMPMNQSGRIDEVYDQLPDFIHESASMSMQTFHPYGDRKDYPNVSDEDWKGIAWDPLQDCFTCPKRHRCGQTLHRDYYRKASDLIICSHDFYMEHVWTKESRKREGQLPLLPESSSVIFDEGHLLEYACQKALTYRLTEQTLETLLTRLTANDVREETLYTIDEALLASEAFFQALTSSSSTSLGSEKQVIEQNFIVQKTGQRLLSLLQKLEEELVFDSELFIFNDYDLKIVEEYLEQMTYSLSLFFKNSSGISWFEENKGEKTLVIMPRLVEDIMREEVFNEKKPFIFSSATLSEEGSFRYIAKSLGIDKYLSFKIDSPFDYEEKMAIYMPKFAENDFVQKATYTIEQINRSNGGALVLFNSFEELSQFKTHAAQLETYNVLFEGESEISSLVSAFQNDENSVLCAVHLWEGLDIPGNSLNNVILFSLPYPPNDPVFMAKRGDAKDPFHEVDLPYMLLRLRQGVGRLIRSEEDKGTVHILIDNNTPDSVVEKINAILPTVVRNNE